jgi:hypothetical protein
MRSIFIVVTTIIVFITTTKLHSQPTMKWIQKATLPISGEPRISFSLNGYGYWGDVNSNSTLWKYNPSTNTWNQKQNLPMTSSGMPAFVINGKAYYMPTKNGKIYVYEYQEELDNWSEVSIFPGEARGASFVFVIGNKAYMTMGINSGGDHLSDVWEFNSMNYQFNQKSDFPFQNRWGGSSFAINGKGYIGMGNLNWNFSDPNGKDLFEYNPISDSWTKKANLPVTQGRYATTGFSISNYGYVLCGEGTNPLVNYDEFWRYDPDTDSWLELEGYGGGGANYLSSFVIDNICYAGKGSLWSFNSSNCNGGVVITPQKKSLTIGSTATFNASTKNNEPSYVWQSDLGQGFQTLYNIGNYSGVKTSTLSIGNVQISEHNQTIRVISTSGNCIDTSNVAVINISDSCITNITVYDTILTTVIDTLIINTKITGLNPLTNINTFKVYPNPASTHITIDFGNYNSMSGYTMIIVNSKGQTMFKAPINHQKSYIDLSTWTGNGIYFLQIIDPKNNTIQNKKILIN